MRYQVPQFIEVEDKIFGPFTFKQFAYLAGGAGIGFIAFKMLPIYIALFIIIPAGVLSASLAFYKMNGRPFIDVIESAFTYYLTSKLYIWRKEDKKPEQLQKEVAEAINEASGMYVPKLSDSKLKDLTWSLDINETIYSKESKKLQSGSSMRQNDRPI